jgi:Mg/Co/Ni transporter MgtE
MSSKNKNFVVVKALHKNLQRKKEEQYKDMLSCLNDDCINFLCECVRNVSDVKVFKNLPKKTQRQIVEKSSPSKDHIKKVIKSSTSIKKKKKILQHGAGWFLPLLSAAIPLISSLFSK